MASKCLHSANNLFLSIATVPTSSQTSPPAIFAISAISRIFLLAAKTTDATAITVSPAPLTSAMLRICVGMIARSLLLS